MTLLLMVLGGTVGTLCRYGTGVLMARCFPSLGFPLGTLTVNLLGSLIVGLLLGVLGVERLTSQAPSDHSWVRPLVLIGFLGAFTTFSSWSLETTLLLQKGELWKALFNIVGSMALGLLLTGIGVWAGQLLVNR